MLKPTNRLHNDRPATATRGVGVLREGSNQSAWSTPAATGTAALLQAAARDARARIERDQRTAPDDIWPLLAHIHSHLFDPTLNVNTLKLACEVETRAVLVQFHEALGEPPRTYIESRRMETTRVLLVASSLAVWKIAELVGFSTEQSFRRAFRRRHGESPSSYRRRRQRTELPSDWRLGDLRRAVTGKLKPRQASALLTNLVRLYATTSRSEAPR